MTFSNAPLYDVPPEIAELVAQLRNDSRRRVAATSTSTPLHHAPVEIADFVAQLHRDSQRRLALSQSRFDSAAAQGMAGWGPQNDRFEQALSHGLVFSEAAWSTRAEATATATAATVADLFLPITLIDADDNPSWTRELHAHVDLSGRFVHNLRLASKGNDTGFTRVIVRSLVFKRFDSLPADSGIEATMTLRSVATLASAGVRDAWGQTFSAMFVVSWLGIHMLPDLNYAGQQLGLAKQVYPGGRSLIDVAPGKTVTVRASFNPAPGASSVWIAYELAHALAGDSHNGYVDGACAYVLDLDSVGLAPFVIE